MLPALVDTDSNKMNWYANTGEVLSSRAVKLCTETHVRVLLYPEHYISQDNTVTLQFRINATLMVNLHWLSPRPGPEQMGYMILCRTFHTAPEQGPEQRRETMGCIHICQVLELFQVVCFNGIQWFPVFSPGPSPKPGPGPRHS